ncbi:hypothetical protein DQ238_21960 [Geodermatophilus sp. TF02-6]|nr:hypothetical protein DQ238_21960 [Geodermatophilus sp. TF02-6]
MTITPPVVTIPVPELVPVPVPVPEPVLPTPQPLPTATDPGGVDQPQWPGGSSDHEDHAPTGRGR